jgi:hypothetical protein
MKPDQEPAGRKGATQMIPICLLVEAIAVEICSRLIVDKVFHLADGGKAKPVIAKTTKGALRVQEQ